MRKMAVAAVAALMMVGVMPAAASAGGNDIPTRGNPLVNSFARAVVTTSESDPWLFDDGCTGGTSWRDPLHVLVPNSDPATLTSKCWAKKGVPIVIGPASYTCWQPTVKAAREECEAGWADPAFGLVKASVKIDGNRVRLSEYRVSGGFTMPADTLLDPPAAGQDLAYYGIFHGVIVDWLKVGRHTVKVAFEYADGFAGETTFTIWIK